MPKTNNGKRILEEFDRLSLPDVEDIGFHCERCENVVKDFISKALKQAREEERKEIINMIKEAETSPELNWIDHFDDCEYGCKKSIINLIQDNG